MLLLTTNDIVRSETVFERDSLIDHGRLLATEPPRTLGSLISRFQPFDVEGASEGLIAEIQLAAGVSSVAMQPDGSVRIEVNEEGATAVVLKQLVAAGVTSVNTSLPSLEEVYVQMIGDRGLTV